MDDKKKQEIAKMIDMLNQLDEESLTLLNYGASMLLARNAAENVQKTA